MTEQIMTYKKFIDLHPDTEDDIAQLIRAKNAFIGWAIIGSMAIGIGLGAVFL